MIAAALLVAGVAWPGRLAFAAGCKWQARRALENRDASRALGWLRWAHAALPHDGETEFLIARAHRRQGQFDLVREHLKTAFTLNFSRRRLEREQWLALAQTGQLREAEPHLAGLLTDPDNEADQICEAYVSGYLVNYRFREALGLIEPWLADYPRDPLPLLLRGKIYVIVIRFPEAERDLRRALELDPENAEIAYELAEVLVVLKQPGDAARFYERAAKSPTWKVRGQVGQGKCLRLAGNVAGARGMLEAALAADPKRWEALLELGRLELETQHAGAAAGLLNQAAQLNPLGLEVRYALACALKASGHAKDAAPHFAFADQARRDLAEAVRLADQVMLHPHDAESRYQIGSIYLKYGADEKGIYWLRSALDETPGHKKAHAALAAYYEGRMEKSPAFAELARQHRQQAQAARGENGEGRSARGQP